MTPNQDLPFEPEMIVGMHIDVFLTCFGSVKDAQFRGAYNGYFVAVNRKTNRIAAMATEQAALDAYPYPAYRLMHPMRKA